jgi:hypothetical protein
MGPSDLHLPRSPSTAKEISMKMHAHLLAATLGIAISLPCMSQTKIEYLKEEPSKGTLPLGRVVYVDDASCPKGEIKEVTGGSQAKSIPRKLRCVKRPG